LLVAGRAVLIASHAEQREHDDETKCPADKT
jgi:hypothetical protein